MESDLTALLACPACRGTLNDSEGGLRCENCATLFPIVDGIPILVLETADQSEDQRRRQATYFDQDVAAEFEIVRPHGAPALYGWLLREKFRRSVTALASRLPGATALAVCAGSGMDAEFLARAGARVIASDISLGAAQRTRDRAARFRLRITSVVADVERLPFRDRSVNLVYVHDGLHHLERPLAGLAEMARVATAAVSVTEPARAGVTAVAVRIGLALEYEEAGNRVARLTTQEIADELRARGFRVVHATRYAMYYGHEPGRPSRWLSSGTLFPVARAGFRGLNAVVGRLGNKLTVQAVRVGT